MNKLTKIGVSALCGSLAAVSAAHAGSMSVAGGATATYTSIGGSVTGNPLGMASNLTFTGTGELESGVGVTLTVTHGDKNTYSSSSIAADVPGLGVFTFDQGGGTGLDRIDDKMPTAWEESYDTGSGAGLATVVGAGGSTDIEWALSADILPADMSAYISWSPWPDGSSPNDKAVGGAVQKGIKGHGWDLVMEYANPLGLVDGLNLFGGYSWIDQLGDARESYGYGATYAVGGITVGYQHTVDSNPSVGSLVDSYDNDAFGVSFQINDDLSVSYGVHESTQEITGNANVQAESESVQVAYSVGGATVKIAEADVENKAYGSSDISATTIAVSLAF
jgi:hypothetical protein